MEEVSIIFHSTRFRMQQTWYRIKLVHKTQGLWHMDAVETGKLLGASEPCSLVDGATISYDCPQQAMATCASRSDSYAKII